MNLVSVLSPEGELRLYMQSDQDVVEWGRLKIGTKMTPEQLVKLVLDLSAVADHSVVKPPAVPLNGTRHSNLEHWPGEQRKSQAYRIRRQIVAAMEQAPDHTMMTTDMVAAAGAKGRSVYPVIADLRDRGVIESPEHSVWRLVSPESKKSESVEQVDS